MTPGISYKLSDLIKKSILKKDSNKSINELLVDILEKEVEWQYEKHDALAQFKKIYKRLINEHCPYTEGSK